MHTLPHEPEPPHDFASFMHAHQDMVFSTALRLTANDAQAQDVTQEVFLKAYQQFEHLQRSPARAGWLKTVATHLSLNHLTRYRRRWRLFSDLRPPRDAENDPDENVDFPIPDTLLDDLAADQRHAAIEHAVSRLPAHQRVPLVLYHFDEMSYADIAESLHISLAKVKIDIRRARIALAGMLSRVALAELTPERLA